MIDHPWAKFLESRADVIDWLYSGEGDETCKNNFSRIASTLSMDAVQVELIHKRNHKFEKGDLK